MFFNIKRIERMSAVVVTAILAITLTACGENTQGAPGPIQNTTNAPSTSSTQGTTDQGDTITVGDVVQTTTTNRAGQEVIKIKIPQREKPYTIVREADEEWEPDDFALMRSVILLSNGFYDPQWVEDSFESKRKYPSVSCGVWSPQCTYETLFGDYPPGTRFMDGAKEDQCTVGLQFNEGMTMSIEEPYWLMDGKGEPVEGVGASPTQADIDALGENLPCGVRY